jgi:hypothetical protein
MKISSNALEVLFFSPPFRPVLPTATTVHKITIRTTSKPPLRMTSTTSAQNTYALLADLSLEDEERHVNDASDDSCSEVNTDYPLDVDGEDEDNLDEEDRIMHTLFDLEALDRLSSRKPVFTKTLLERIAADVARNSLEFRKPVSERKLGALHWTTQDGQSIEIWKDVCNSNYVSVNYMTHIEMSPEFQRRFGNKWARTKLFRALNASLPQEKFEHLAAPYYLKSSCRLPDTVHHDATEMNSWRTNLHNTQELWEESASCNQMCILVRSGVAKLKAPITKIVCIGLGRLDTNPAFYQSAIQHMTVFSFAETLDAHNRTQYPDCPPVTIIAQDPCYEERDRILLQELTKSHIDFSRSDPETLLAIDANTLVATAFLPCGVLLMQIMADLFADRPGEGPGMILCDKMSGLADRQKTHYAWRQRDSPAVARFLRGGYIACQGSFVGLEEELKEDLFLATKTRKYWLEEMVFCLRRDKAASKA